MIAKDFAQQLFDLHDRVAFVTGAGSGIGQMIALALASAGARVVCFDLREDGGLKETVNHIEALGGQALYYTGDVRELRDLRAAVALAKTHFGRLDIAVNAAGIANANPALEMESEQWQRVIDINLTGVWNSCKAEAELMVEKRRRFDYKYCVNVRDYCQSWSGTGPLQQFQSRRDSFI
ncbi:short chain dehydrogenase [Escherichia coli]|uniref:Short chain dehydrogenase n=1 Tax=Escherichia coli TaxID=562 RepID=A0A377KA87_ECOLX|nr:short chain dehydrogenase [Escherichia coli]